MTAVVPVSLEFLILILAVFSIILLLRSIGKKVKIVRKILLKEYRELRMTMNRAILGLGTILLIMGFIVLGYHVETSKWVTDEWGDRALITVISHPYWAAGLIISLLGLGAICVSFLIETSPKQNIIVCPKCGAKNLKDWKFCSKCGEPLRRAESEY
jgi:ribosomal protein L40E